MKSLSPSLNHVHLPQYLQATADQIIRSINERKYCAVLGPRFSGKTDLLNLVREELEYRSRVVVQVNLYNADATKPSDFFNNLAKIISQQLANQSRVSEIIAVSVSDSSTFRSFIQDVINHVNNELVLIIDHLEGVPNDLVRLLLTSLRAIYMEQQSNSEHRLVAIVAGALSLAGIATGETSPFRGIAELVIVDLPPDDESEKYITTFFSNLNIQISSSVRRHLIHAARGDQQLIKVMCEKCAQMIAEKKPKQLNISIVKGAAQEFILKDANFHAPIQEALRLFENDPDLLTCALLLLKKKTIYRKELSLPLSPDVDPLYLTGAVRKDKQNGYQFRNEIYKQFLVHYFNPGRVGHLLSMAGRWDQAIDYLEFSIEKGEMQYLTNLLAATISSMYASPELNYAARYLARGLFAGFNIREGRIWYYAKNGEALKLIGYIGKAKKGELAIGREMPISGDSLEVRSYREARALKGQAINENFEWAIPLHATDRKSIGVVEMIVPALQREGSAQREWELEFSGYLHQAALALQDVETRNHWQSQLGALDQITLNIAGRLEIEQILQTAIEKAIDLVGGTGGRIYLWDEKDETFTLKASDRFQSSLKGTKFDKDRGVIGEIRRTKKPFSKNEYYKWADRQLVFDEDHMTAVTGAPILSNKKLLGVIAIHALKDGKVYGEKDEELLMRFGNHVAIALENATLFEQLELENTSRTDESLALQIVGISLTETFDLTAILNRVMQAALKLIQGDEGSILFFDEVRDEFLPEALMSTGIGQPLQPYVTQVRQQKGLAYQIVKERKSVAISNTESNSQVSKVSVEKGRQAMVGVPLISHEGSVGVLWVNWKRPRKLSGREGNLLTALASQATVAIQGAKRYAEIQEYARLTEGLIGAGQFISTFHPIRNELQTIIDNLRKSKNYDNVVLHVYDQNIQEFEPPISSGKLKIDLALGPIKKGNLVWKILNGETDAYFSSDTLNDHLLASSFTKREGIRSSGFMRLTKNNNPLGIIFINTRTKHDFSKDDQATIKRYVDQAIALIENNSMFQPMIDELSKIMKLDILALHLYDAKRMKLGVPLLSKTLPDQCDWLSNFPFKNGLDLGHDFSRFNPDGDFANGNSESLCGTSSYFKLVFSGRPVGILSIHWHHNHAWSENEKRAVRLFSNQIAAAIDNTYHYKSLEQNQLRLRALLEASKAITLAGLERDTILQAISEQAKAATGASLATIQLVDGNDLVFISASPVEKLEGLLRNVGRMPINGPGITTKAFRSGTGKLVPNVETDEDFFAIPGQITGSEVAVVINSGNKPIGVLDVEHQRIGELDEDDLGLLQALANLAIVALQNAEQYEALLEARDELLAAGTIAWMGLFGSEWSHTVAQKTFAIRTYADAIKELMSVANLEIMQKLDRIDIIARDIQAVPLAISTPAQAEVGEPLLIDEFLQNETLIICKSHEDIHPDLLMGCKETLVKVDRSLLKMALQKLIDNAIRNMPPNGNLIVESRHGDDGTIIIAIQDTGSGIPENIKNIYGHQRIPKEDGQPGSGMGAMLARFILKKFGGDLRLAWSEMDKGTRIEIVLPAYHKLKEENSKAATYNRRLS